MNTGFYNHNMNRSYPFVTDTVGLDNQSTLLGLPSDAVVDVGFLASCKSRFDDGEHTVYLNRVYRSGTTFYFEFASDAPGLFETVITFSREVDSLDYEIEYADSGTQGLSDSGSESRADACDEALWYGFLVTGRMTELAVLLPGDGVILRGSSGAVVEPSLVQSLAESYVSRVGLANDDRTRVEGAVDCDAVTSPFEDEDIRVSADCLVGELVLRPGYNTVLRQNPRGGVTLTAAVGAGAGEICGELAAFDDEIPPDDGDLLTGGPRCNEVLRSVNGAGGPRLAIEAGSGVTVTPEPESNRVVINVSLVGMATSGEEPIEVSESC